MNHDIQAFSHSNQQDKRIMRIKNEKNNLLSYSEGRVKGNPMTDIKFTEKVIARDNAKDLARKSIEMERLLSLTKVESKLSLCQKKTKLGEES